MSDATMPKGQYFYAVGRRKSAVARVRLYPGEGNFIVNGKPVREYFGGRELNYTIMDEPFRATGTTQRYDIVATVVGGGTSGQVGAIRHGISRALTTADGDLRPALKSEGLLTRDAREKERKKVGLKRARKAPQYTKR
jgi:small subunit ribosomal protein S9